MKTPEQLKGTIRNINDVRNEEALRVFWTNYITENIYASGLSFDDVVDTVYEIGRFINS